MRITPAGEDLIVTGISDFSLSQTLDCGQCFRWKPVALHTYRGIAFRRELTISQPKEDVLIFHRTSQQVYQKLWRHYFALDEDYSSIKAILLQDTTLQKAIAFAPGIRILRQNSWEALASFILSQNNNIKRICGIVARLCETFGDPLPGGGFSFPSPQQLMAFTVEQLAPVRCGFRAKYLLDAARKISSGELCLSHLQHCELKVARERIQQIYGVGPKVAECTLLYGLHRLECFPVDVWMHRVVERYYPDGLPDFVQPYAGIAQQYLFHYARWEMELNPSKQEEAILY